MRTMGSLAAALGGLALLAGATTAQAQDRQVSLDVRGGVAVPTFDIADVADPGPSVGVGVGVPLGERWTLRGTADFGFHDSALEGGPDVNVFHYIGGLGYELVSPTPDSPWRVSVNAGAGAMSFDVDVEGAETHTYFAINAGGEIEYLFSDNVSFLLSPQGDIAFSDEDEVGTDNAWVWPFTAGLSFRFGG